MPSEGTVRDGPASGFQLIETMRWEPGTGLLRGDLHLRRLSRSASELGFRCDLEALEQHLAQAVGGETPLRVRLTLSNDGEVAVTTQPFTPLPPNTVWNLKIAEIRLDRNDPLLRHKTTRRDTHDRARAEISPYDADEVILLNGEGQVCEGTITNVFVGDGNGAYLTPPLGCGLLPGILREELLAEGRAKGAEITPEMLEKAEEFFVGNSLRGLVRARLVAG